MDLFEAEVERVRLATGVDLLCRGHGSSNNNISVENSIRFQSTTESAELKVKTMTNLNTHLSQHLNTTTTGAHHLSGLSISTTAAPVVSLPTIRSLETRAAGLVKGGFTLGNVVILGAVACLLLHGVTWAAYCLLYHQCAYCYYFRGDHTSRRYKYARVAVQPTDDDDEEEEEDEYTSHATAAAESEDDLVLALKKEGDDDDDDDDGNMTAGEEEGEEKQ